MTLSQFKSFIESLPDNSTFDYSLSQPFSWRGSFDEVAFDIYDQPSTKSEVLWAINLAYDKKGFKGYKGGTYFYDDDTCVNFEKEPSEYSGGGYSKFLYEKLTKNQTLEMQVVNLAFKTT